MPSSDLTPVRVWRTVPLWVSTICSSHTGYTDLTGCEGHCPRYKAASPNDHLDVILARTSGFAIIGKADSTSRIKHFDARLGPIVQLCFQLMLRHGMLCNSSKNRPGLAYARTAQIRQMFRHICVGSSMCSSAGSGDINVQIKCDVDWRNPGRNPK